eukprot:5785363-Prymnesium_polylepis.2
MQEPESAPLTGPTRSPWTYRGPVPAPRAPWPCVRTSSRQPARDSRGADENARSKCTSVVSRVAKACTMPARPGVALATLSAPLGGPSLQRTAPGRPPHTSGAHRQRVLLPLRRHAAHGHAIPLAAGASRVGVARLLRIEGRAGHLRHCLDAPRHPARSIAPLVVGQADRVPLEIEPRPRPQRARQPERLGRHLAAVDDERERLTVGVRDHLDQHDTTLELAVGAGRTRRRPADA